MLKLKPGKFILHSPCLLSYTFTSKASKICTLMTKIQSLSKKGKGADYRLKGSPQHHTQSSEELRDGSVQWAAACCQVQWS